MRVLAAIIITALPAAAETGSDKWWSTPTVTACCSIADAVYADEWESAPGGILVIVTGAGPRTPWAPVGRKYFIPQSDIKHEPGNPTGHSLLFLNQHDLGRHYCFITGPLT
jgi:hypothetical protein